MRRPPVSNLGALGDGVADEGFHGVEPARMGERAHAGAVLEPVSDFDGLRGVEKLAHELVVGRLLHHEPCRRDAHLAGVTELGGAQRFGRRINISVGEDDRGRMAAELHGDAFHVLAGEHREVLADRGRAGERDLADHRMRDQVGRDFARHAEHEIDHAGREAGLHERIDQCGARRRRLFRPFDDDRAAGCDRG